MDEAGKDIWPGCEGCVRFDRDAGAAWRHEHGTRGVSGESHSDGGTQERRSRARPQIAVSFRDGWQWATVEGNAELVGVDDPQPWLTDSDVLRLLLRDVFTAAGGTHDDWAEYDRVMAEQGRTVVFVAPSRVYSNG